MRSGKMKLLGTSALVGPMTAAERQRGRYMRAPDHSDFDEFVNAGEVETGSGAADIDVSNDGMEPPKPEPKAKRRGPPKEKVVETPVAPEPGEGDDGEDLNGEEEDGEEEDDEKPEPKPKQKASERIRELTKRNGQLVRTLDQLTGRLEALEKGGLQTPQGGGNSADEIGAAPDPTDTETYPLGHLDERYVEDKLEWLANKTAADRADRVLQRQQESERTANAQKAQEVLLTKVDDLAERGSADFEDFQETVIDTGLKGEWKLDQPTFEAAHEAENGARILYDLAKDPVEAERVAKLSPVQQVKYVLEKDAELSGKAKPRTKPGAGAPPAHPARGTSSKGKIDPATDNLDDFEKAWAADVKGKR